MMKRNNAGFTLIEVMLAVTLLTAISMVLYYVNLALTKSVLEQQSLTTLRDDGRISVQHISRRLRCADTQTLMGVSGGTLATLGTTPVTTIEFQIVTDGDDDNSNAIDKNFDVELSDPLRFGPDTDDANADGFKSSQLVEFDTNGKVLHIFTNYLDPSGGVSFVRTSGGVEISLVLLRPAQGIRPPARVRMDMVIDPRN